MHNKVLSVKIIILTFHQTIYIIVRVIDQFVVLVVKIANPILFALKIHLIKSRIINSVFKIKKNKQATF